MAELTFADELTASPSLYPFTAATAGDTVEFLRLSRSDYAAASFLDSRMLTPGMPRLQASWGEVRTAAAALPLRCHFIFHISHVGSTLLSRLIGDAPALFSIREPAIFRTLADVQLQLGRQDCPWSAAEFDQRLDTFLGLWSRTFAPEEISVIKATSFVSEMSELLMRRVPESRAILMVVSPLTFLAALLDGAMSDITSQAERRMHRLHRRLGASPWQLTALSPGECVAMSWLCEVLSLYAAATQFSSRTFWLDFDHFLFDVPGGLAASLRHLGAASDADSVRAILAKPTLQHYAKKPECAYDATMRAELLRHSSNLHKDEIRKGLAWLERASQLPGVAGMLNTIHAAVKQKF